LVARGQSIRFLIRQSREFWLALLIYDS